MLERLGKPDGQAPAVCAHICWIAVAGQRLEFGFGSGAGIRTLNLAVNRSLQPVQKSRSVFAECRRVPPIGTWCRRRCCTKPPWRNEGALPSDVQPRRVDRAMSYDADATSDAAGNSILPALTNDATRSAICSRTRRRSLSSIRPSTTAIAPAAPVRNSQ